MQTTRQATQAKPEAQNAVSERTVREQFRVKHAGDETLRPRSETLDFLKYCGSTDVVTPSSVIVIVVVIVVLLVFW